MRLAAALAVCIVALGAARPAAAQSGALSVDLSEPVIEITTSFAGTRVLLFGAIEGRGDIAVVVRGPSRTEVVRRKDRVFGVWVNAASRTFDTVPAYYHVASTRPLEEIASEQVLERHQIGVGRIRFGYDPGQPTAEMEVYRAALIRNKQQVGLYSSLANRVGVTDGRLFRATFTFPANVATGAYSAHVYFFRDGRLIGEKVRTLAITKVGLEASIFNFAHQQAALYGIMAILIALISGWLAGVIFRKA